MVRTLDPVLRGAEKPLSVSRRLNSIVGISRCRGLLARRRFPRLVAACPPANIAADFTCALCMAVRVADFYREPVFRICRRLDAAVLSHHVRRWAGGDALWGKRVHRQGFLSLLRSEERVTVRGVHADASYRRARWKHMGFHHWDKVLVAGDHQNNPEAELHFRFFQLSKIKRA